MRRCQNDPTCGIFLRRELFKDIKNDIPMSQTFKYNNTNTQAHKYTNRQIHHMTRYQKGPTCGIFLKRGLFEDIKNGIPISQICKYKFLILIVCLIKILKCHRSEPEQAILRSSIWFISWCQHRVWAPSWLGANPNPPMGPDGPARLNPWAGGPPHRSIIWD